MGPHQSHREIILLAGILLSFAGASSLAAERPNILFIIADDQSPFDLKIYNPKSTLQTPNIDRLAARGMVFDGAHQMGSWVGGVCTASRHMIMSGRTLWHIPDKPGRLNNPHTTNPKLVPPDLPAFTLPAVFNEAGYRTVRTCKKGNSYEAANQLFTVRSAATKRGGTDDTGSAWHADRVLEYLQQREAKEQTDPFLIYFGFSHPHDKRDGKQELLKKYGAVKWMPRRGRKWASSKGGRSSMSCSSRLSMAVAAALLLASPPGFAHAEDPVKLKEVRLTDDGRLKREGCCADPGR